jgi:CHRD domain-containing protein
MVVRNGIGIAARSRVARLCLERRTAMRRPTVPLLLAIGMTMMLLAPGVFADTGARSFSARLNGFEETPSISTTGRGTFRATLVNSTTLAYTLSYTIELTSAPAVQAHIHLGQRSVAGGVSAFLCGGGDKPACPSPGGTVSGTIDPADVIGPNNQGLEPGAFDELVRAMRAGFTYANVHSNRFPAGEIRGQIKPGDDDND